MMNTAGRRLLRPLTQHRNSSHLSAPTWSVRTLLPSASSPQKTTTVSLSKIAHLLRLSALPPPADPASLNDHLHFVRSLQSVNTTDVAPLAAIRDEIDTSKQEYSYRDLLEAEEKLNAGGVGDSGRVEWDPVERAKRKVGRYFVVDEAVTEEMVKPEVEGKE